MKIVRWLLAASAVMLLAVSTQALADTGRKGREDSAFGTIRGREVAEAKKQAEAWLKSVGKTDAATQAKFKTIWESDRSLADRVADTLVLGDAQAAKLLADVRNTEGSAPVAVPALLKGKDKPLFFRANLTLAYARALANRKVYEEALEAFNAVKVDDVVDPSSYLFFRAVCEYELMLKDKAEQTIDRLLVSVTDAPERYRMVGALMHFDMLTWQEKDLGWIARKMDNIQRRLDLRRGGKQTQKMQREVLVRLDEMIKELENQQKSPGGS
jgi:tetratricopeptide (TPR) repeat protein